MIRLAVALFALVFALTSPPSAKADDTSEIRAIIEGQLLAFRADDAEKAYSFAAPIIKEIFPTQDSFIEMVRKGYPQVYRSKTYEFGTLDDTDFGLAQFVSITDESGQKWTALYTVEKQKDGSWKISGCRILKEPGTVS